MSAIQEIIKGLANLQDVNGDGKVDVKDAIAIITKSLKLEDLLKTLLDVNKDGKINFKDLTAIALRLF